MHPGLELVNDSLGVLLRARLSAQVARPGSLGDGLQRGLVDPVCERVELHVPEHHHAREEERSRVGAAVWAAEPGSSKRRFRFSQFSRERFAICAGR